MYCPYAGPDANGLCCAANERGGRHLRIDRYWNPAPGVPDAACWRGRRRNGRRRGRWRRGCADSYSSDCGDDDEGDDDTGEPTLTRMDSETEKIKNCMANKSKGEKFFEGIKDADITFEYRALESGEGHTSGLRLGNTDGSSGNYTIIIDIAAIERSARSANWSHRSCSRRC